MGATRAWLQDKGVSLTAIQSEKSKDGTLWASAATNINNDEVVLRIPGDLCATAADAAGEPTIGALVAGRGELTSLALWLIAERQKGDATPWAPLLASLPERVDTPLMWTEEQRKEWLKGSPVAQQSRDRERQLRAEWQQLYQAAADLPPAVYNEESFLAAMCVVLAHSVYLPSAECFAMVPALSGLRRSGSASAAVVDYDIPSESVTITASRTYRLGDEVAIYDGRPNGELCMATGVVQKNNPADYLTIEASLVAADRLYSVKKEILEGSGFTTPQEFPITVDGMPVQLLSYMRMARIQDSAEFAKVSFEKDIIITPSNEYEVLQLLLADCRDRFTAYGDNMEADVKALQRKDLSPPERLATQLRLEEKRIVAGTMDAVRRRLDPIRGIPTKSGALQDPNQDFLEMFQAIEGVPQLPGKLLGGFKRWASGEDDPDWGKKGKGKKGQSIRDMKRPW
eukprot:CAMPEP_0206140612 /NCGR_PEP_ID=MMETSP1473-20131121/10038_1 /ASSEMBLY_ACC=CAM_ASM_001109 /TAXON_ID=1461547 /ORGANISM="Stichococcus sp, Strain RCC1054" /LENGTH=455 /DNA_ID=CAMNT_0053534817 /DNA_START=485 /DNA_END=1852 /DNA_ORIENTATION=-